MSEKNAIGGNYKFKNLKIFGSIENFYNNKKSYRMVFDVSECRYVYAELSFYNKLFDERDWTCKARLVCVDEQTEKEICDLKKDITIKKEHNIFNVREGWGTPNPGWWKKGKYRWDTYLDDKFLKSIHFYVLDGGLVTTQKNPYIKLKSVKLFESAIEGLHSNKRKYLKTFNKGTTRYINAEITVDVLRQDPLIPLQFKANCFNDIGQHKAYMEYFKEVTDERKELTFDVGYGSNKGDYWYADDYTLEIQFMNQLIGVVPFKVADEEEVAEGSLSFAIDNSAQELKVEEKEVPKITFEEATAKLNALIGLGAVKKQIDEFSTYLKFLRIRKEKGFKEDNKFNLHTVFTGNPGTGKTTVAKMLGDIYYSLGLLSKGDVYEVGRVDLVGEYIGQTAPKVKKAINKARGGILFVDEAYALSDRGEDGKDLGKEVIEVLIKEMSDGPGDIAIVFAGYPKQMKKFVERNPGMASRISSSIHFPDYVPDELMEIAVYAAKQRDVFFHLDAQAFLYKKIVEAYRTRTDNFGNARFINAVVEECKQTMALRLMRAENFDKMSKTDMATISLGDVEKSFGGANVQQVHIPIDEAMLDEALKELHEMVGLDQVKRDIDEMAKLVRYYTEIGRDVKKAFSMHTVFTGNPGTGKTTVARVIVKIYKALGILEQGHLVECDRKELVAGYIGQTAIKTAEMIDKAIGGGLFIDEAYSLNTGTSNDFGREAVDTLLKRMEDQRGEFIVIAAGYPNEMKAFLELNPGLMSRFDRTLHFEDFSQKELFHIALTMFDKENLFLNDIACDYLKSHISKLVQHKHKYFGNARTIRKVVQEVARRQNLRLALMAAEMRTAEMIKTVTIEDFGDLQLIEQDKREERRGIGFSFGNS